MHTQSIEDTIIGSPQNVAMELFGNDTESSETASGGVFERCRAMFRTLGEQMTSFELSRQIYGY